MGANQSSSLTSELDSKTMTTRPVHNRTNSNHDLRSTESTKKMRLDDLLQYTSPTHTDSHVELASRIDRVANLPPAPITSLQRMATTKVNQERSSLKVMPSSPSIEELSDTPAVMPLIKRRSLLYAATPGLSTRAPHVEKKAMSELGPISETVESSLLPHNRNNADRAILEILRTATPAITSLPLGSFRQGTLRIVNGAPSPIATPKIPSQDFRENFESLVHPLHNISDVHSRANPSSTSEAPRADTDMRHVQESHRRLVRSTSAKLEADFKAFLDGQNPEDCKTEEQKSILKRARSKKELERTQTCASLDLDDQVEVLRVVSRQSTGRSETTPKSQSMVQHTEHSLIRTDVTAINDEDDGSQSSIATQYTSKRTSEELKATQGRCVSLASTNSSQDDATTVSSNLERVSSSSSLESYQSTKPSRVTESTARSPSARSIGGRAQCRDVEGPATFEVHRGKPKKLEDMLRISSGPNANCWTPSSPASSHSVASASSTTSSRRGKSVPLSYVPFEPVSAGSKESKVKFYRTPQHYSKKQKEENPEFGMRIQTASTTINKVLTRGTDEGRPGQRALPRGPRPMLDRSMSSNSGYSLSDTNSHEIVVEVQAERPRFESVSSKTNQRNLTSGVTQR